MGTHTPSILSHKEPQQNEAVLARMEADMQRAATMAVVVPVIENVRAKASYYGFDNREVGATTGLRDMLRSKNELSVVEGLLQQLEDMRSREGLGSPVAAEAQRPHESELQKTARIIRDQLERWLSREGYGEADMLAQPQRDLLESILDKEMSALAFDKHLNPGKAWEMGEKDVWKELDELFAQLDPVSIDFLLRVLEERSEKHYRNAHSAVHEVDRFGHDTVSGMTSTHSPRFYSGDIERLPVDFLPLFEVAKCFENVIYSRSTSLNDCLSMNEDDFMAHVSRVRHVRAARVDGSAGFKDLKRKAQGLMRQVDDFSKKMDALKGTLPPPPGKFSLGSVMKNWVKEYDALLASVEDPLKFVLDQNRKKPEESAKDYFDRMSSMLFHIKNMAEQLLNGVDAMKKLDERSLKLNYFDEMALSRGNELMLKRLMKAQTKKQFDGYVAYWLTLDAYGSERGDREIKPDINAVDKISRMGRNALPLIYQCLQDEDPNVSEIGGGLGWYQIVHKLFEASASRSRVPALPEKASNQEIKALLLDYLRRDYGPKEKAKK